MKKTLILIAALTMTTGPGHANAVERACNASDRQAATRALCDCIGDVAEMTLSNREQRQAARFFGDPHEAQVVRMSSNRSDENFWDRYVAFGRAAERICG